MTSRIQQLICQAISDVYRTNYLLLFIFNMEDVVIELIEKTIKDHPRLMHIALRQKAKFEGWLKFELAQRLEDYGVTELSVEYSYDKGKSADISYLNGRKRYLLELKTSNTNWVVPGIQSKTRPITKNIDSIIDDGFKLQHSTDVGILVFILFPIPNEDKRWNLYLERISNLLGVIFKENENFKVINYETLHVWYKSQRLDE